MRAELDTRNRGIAEAVLSGLTVKEAARQYGISRSRCQQIVHMVCRRTEPELYRSLRTPGQMRVPIKTLREYAEVFLVPLDVDDILTLQSPLRRIPELPTITINALKRDGICTIGDFFSCDLDSLRKIPMLGEIGLQKIQEALQAKVIDE